MGGSYITFSDLITILRDTDKRIIAHMESMTYQNATVQLPFAAVRLCLNLCVLATQARQNWRDKNG